MNRRLSPESSINLTFLVLALAMGIALVPGQGYADISQMTVPLYMEGNRPYIDLTFRGPDGSTRSARFLVDTGGGRSSSRRWSLVTSD